MADEHWLRKLFARVKGLWDRTLEPERFGDPDQLEPLELRRAILRQAEREGRSAGWQRRVLPGNHLEILVQARDAQRHALLRRALVDGGDFEEEVRQRVSRHVAGEVRVKIRLVEDDLAAEAGVPYELIWSQADLEDAQRQEVLHLKVERGKATQKSYRFQQEKVNVGRLEEVENEHGFVVHRNDVAFDDEDERSRSVSRRHAVFMWRDGGYVLRDLESGAGTQIFRDGKAIKVSSRVHEGLGVRDGDTVYVGQASLKVRIKPPARPDVPPEDDPATEAD